MDYAISLILKFLSIILIAIVGYIIMKRNVFGEKGKDVISLLLNRIALPFLVLSSYASVKLNSETMMNVIYIIIAGIIIYIINYIYSALLAKKYKLEPKQRSVFVNGAVHANTAFLAFPLLYAVFGEEGMFYGTIYFMVDNVMQFTVGVKRLQQDSVKKKEIAPLTISLLIALPLMIILNIFNLDITDTVVYTAAFDLGNMTTPLAFIFIGMVVGENKIVNLFLNKLAMKLIVIKLIIIPILAILFFYFVPLNLESTIIIIIMIELLMPSFTSLLSLSHEYQQDTDLAASLVVAGHLISIITIPVIFSIVIFLFN